jgi:hypothetical protein
VQVGLLVELLQGEAGELFCSGLGVAAAGDAAAGVQGAGGQEGEAYKLPNIASKGFSEGSADGAAEGDSGEAARAEGEAGDAVEGGGLSVLLVNVRSKSTTCGGEDGRCGEKGCRLTRRYLL